MSTKAMLAACAATIAIVSNTAAARTQAEYDLDVSEQPLARSLRDVASKRSEEHTSELQSLMRNSYAVFRLKKKIKLEHDTHTIDPKSDKTTTELTSQQHIPNTVSRL